MVAVKFSTTRRSFVILWFFYLFYYLTSWDKKISWSLTESLKDDILRRTFVNAFHFVALFFPIIVEIGKKKRTLHNGVLAIPYSIVYCQSDRVPKCQNPGY
jgi:hypothetical protein